MTVPLVGRGCTSQFDVLARPAAALTVGGVTAPPPLTAPPDICPSASTRGVLGDGASHVVRPVAAGSGVTLSFRRVGDSLLDVTRSGSESVLAVRALREADGIREAVLARPGGFSEQRPIVVDFHVGDDGSVVVDWVRGDYAVTRGIGAVRRDAGGVDFLTGPRWLRFGAMGLNVTVRTADEMTAVSVRAASMVNGGLAHVPMNEGLNAVDVPDSAVGDVVPFDLFSATRRGMREELGIDLGVGGLGLVVDSVFEVVGHGLAVSAHVDLRSRGVTGAALVACAAEADDAWERDALHLLPVAERQPPAGVVVAGQERFTGDLAELVGARGATSWAAWCFAASGLWPAPAASR